MNIENPILYSLQLSTCEAIINYSKSLHSFPKCQIFINKNNKYQSGKLACPLKLDDVGAVIISYIAYFTMEENQDKKYYF